MTDIPLPALLETIDTLLVEAYDGPPDPSGTWWIDNEANSGILGILANVTAAEASTSVDGSEDNGRTIASNAEHLRWSLANINATLRGHDYNGKWSESWLVNGADAAQWDALRWSLKDEYETLRGLIQQQTELPAVYLNGLIALIPHAAFHLGLMRQMIERVRQPRR